MLRQKKEAKILRKAVNIYHLTRHNETRRSESPLALQ